MTANYPTNDPSDASLLIAANNVSSTLNGGVSSGATSMTLASSANFPSAGGITIETEAILYTGNNTGTSVLSGLTRGADSTTAAVHADGTPVYMNMQARHHNQLKDEIIAIGSDLRNAIDSDLDDTVLPSTTAATIEMRLDQLSTQIKRALSTVDWKDTRTGYRRPVLKWISVTTVDVENNTGTANETEIVFPDGERRAVTEDTASANKYRRMDITADAEFTSGTEDSGLRAALTEATNTWYAIYAVKSLIDTSKFVLVGDTTLPLQANFATLNSAYGTNGWVYLGLIRNGDQSGATGDILSFTQTGNVTLFRVAANNAGVEPGRGIVMATTTNTTTTTYTYATGTAGQVFPSHIGKALWTVGINPGSTGLISYLNAAGSFAYGKVSNQTSTHIASLLVVPNEGIQTSGPAASNHVIFLTGFFDTVLGVGSNPQL